MNNESDTNELIAIGEMELFEGMLDYLLLEGIGLIFTLVALVLFIIASIKLIRKSNIPGSKLIFASIILTIIGTILSGLSEFYYSEESSLLFDVVINIYQSVVFFTGSYGFLRVSNYVTSESSGN